MSQENAPSSEKRHFHRIVFDDAAVLRFADKTLRGRIIDVSLKGALARLEEPHPELAVDDECELSFALAEDVTISMQARIRHKEGMRLGLHCEHIDLESVQHLRRLIELNLGDDTLLQRELGAMFEDFPIAS